MQKPKVIVQGERITLTEATIFDAERTLSAIDQDASKNLKRFAEGHVALSEQRAYLNRLWNSKTDRLYLIEHSSPNANPIGSIGLHEIDWSNRTARLGVLIFRPGDRGLGYGAESIGLAHHVAFEELDLNRICANVIAGNDANLQRFLKLGYHVEGRLREAYLRDGVFHDMIALSILKTDW